jgi:amino acid transporter
VKTLWWLAIAIEAAIVIGFCVATAQSDYFTHMPLSVRSGRSIRSLVLERGAWLSGILVLINASALMWIRGVEYVADSQRLRAVAAMSISVIVFLVACALLIALAFFGFPQY